MPHILGIENLNPSEEGYLKTLAEAYNSATSWETRRQLLFIMSGIVKFDTLVALIPGLTRSRYSMANLNCLQYGPGAELPSQPSQTRIKIDVNQLDYFLDFITSPHLVQDLPFGQRKLKLSSGEVIEVPNVIRTMIPQRIARQYSQYCHENGFTPFSERTMLHVLSECSASVRKSLQGLDHYAADGAKAFDNLLTVVRQIGEFGAGKDWETLTIDNLRTIKMYLKGDYNVTPVF